MKQLLFTLTKKDFTIQAFRAGGKGGQHQNKVSSAIRIIHNESGARGECRNYREQHRNKEEAFKRLCNSKEFKLWHKLECSRLMSTTDSRTIDEIVNEQMDERNLVIENVTV